jgi:hypothetical protein
MGLADKINEQVAARKRMRVGFCAYQTLYESVSKEDQKAIDDAWEKGYSINIILSALRSDGHKSSNESLRAHKNGTCKCQKS